MKTLYLECNMGAAGDMLMAALLELHDNPADFLNRLNNAGIPGTVVAAEASVKCGVTGTHIAVRVNGREEAAAQDHEHEHHHHHEHEHHHHHEHNDYKSIEALIDRLAVSSSVKKDAVAVYRLIADAESRVHGVPVDQIHFHEVGEMDAITDIVGVCMLMEEIAPEMIMASPINTGGGTVRCAHGILPVPAPAAALILQGLPVYSDGTKGELCTPTGAALLKHFVTVYGSLPVIRVNALGYGMGTKDFEQANCLRAYLGDADNINKEVSELVCNLDDMTPESVAFAQQLLMEEGALDVYTTPIGMKKGRAGLSLTCMCCAEDRERMLSLLFKHTTTLGVRDYTCRRYTLQKEQSHVQTPYGTVRVKTSRGFGVIKTKAEYEDIAGIARQHNKSVHEIANAVNKAIT